MFPQGQGQGVGGELTTSTVNQQHNSLLGMPPTQMATMPTFNPQMLNDTSMQSNPQAMSMIKALKGAI